jgi:glycerol uptake facilitator-like aquaporin
LPAGIHVVTVSLAVRPKGLVRATARAALAELIATAFLLIAVVGSGIMAERLCGGNVGLALLANAIATGGALVALILAFGPQSGAHMNPVVTLAAAATGGLEWHAVPAYIGAQIAGAVIGVWLAHVMFELPVWQISHHIRTGPGQWVAEIVATFGLLMVIWGCRAYRAPVTPFAVAAYITGAYWFTASTSFANPAVTIARALSDSFAGIRPADAPGFILAQLVALILALPLLRRHAPADQENDL